MNKPILNMAMLTALAVTNVNASDKVYDEVSLQMAFDAANVDSSIEEIVFEKNAHIMLKAPVIYNGSQALALLGNGATIDGSAAGDFTLDKNLTAVTEDGTLIFNTASAVSVQGLTIENSATRGIVINIPEHAQGEDIDINFHKVNILNSALYGLHIDDNADEFDDGVQGSAIGIDLRITQSNFTGNGTGAIDFDGIRVDERAAGDINAVILHTHIDSNGGDGIELDEAGAGNVDAIMMHVTINKNGFFNKEDLDDGFDIDEAGEGDIKVNLFEVEVNDNMDEGLDFDEENDGDVEIKVRRIVVLNNADEGIKVDEENAGVIKVDFSKLKVMDSGDDGIQFTEIGEGDVEVLLKKVTSNNNKKYGIKIEQWLLEDENVSVEEPGVLEAKQVILSGNGKGDEIKTNNVTAK
jgi:hypothetical protein